MKILLRVLVIALHAAMLVTVVQNWATSVNVDFGQIHYTNLSLGYIVLKCYGLGLVAMGIEFFMSQRQLSSQLKQWELRKEKAEVQAETQTDQVTALESKVKTLEKALETALAATQKKDA